MSDQGGVVIKIETARKMAAIAKELGRQHDVDRQIHEIIGNNPVELARHSRVAAECAEVTREVRCALAAAEPKAESPKRRPRAPHLGLRKTV